MIVWSIGRYTVNLRSKHKQGTSCICKLSENCFLLWTCVLGGKCEAQATSFLLILHLLCNDSTHTRAGHIIDTQQKICLTIILCFNHI